MSDSTQHHPLQTYSPGPEAFSDQVILITGAGDGIGRALAQAFAAHGATVVLLGRTVAKLEQVYDEILAAGHPEPAIYPMDLAGATSEHYDELAERVHAQLGRLDGVIHNAAMLGTATPFEQTNPKEWAMVMQVNLTAAFELTRALLPLLKAAPRASVLFTGAEAGRSPRAYGGAYAVSKYALEGLMRVVADETEQHTAVRVNSVDPGPVRTRLRATSHPGELPGALPSPADVVGLYLYLMSEPGAEIHGQALRAGEFDPAAQ